MQPDPGAMAPVRVVVVDADDRVRESLARLLCIGHHIEVVGVAGGAESALDVVLSTDPDVVVVDPRLPEVDAGLAFIRRLRVSAPGVRVLVLGGTETPQIEELSESSDGVVRKTFRSSDLLTAILGAGCSS